LNLFNIELPQANIKRNLGDYKLWEQQIPLTYETQDQLL
jgi:hypothetical protein